MNIKILDLETDLIVCCCFSIETAIWIIRALEKTYINTAYYIDDGSPNTGDTYTYP